MNKGLSVNVCLSPYLYPVYEKDNSIVVIIDIFRATSAICTAFQYGVDKIIPVASVQEAEQYKAKGFLVGAERNGIALEGFDFGNSPYNYMCEKIKGKTVVISTTNGTQALDVASGASEVVVGSFLNITALCNWLLQQQKNILLLCSGWKNKFNMEDTLFAGAVAQLFINKNYAYDDCALSSMLLYDRAKKNPYYFFRKGSHAQRLSSIGLKNDIRYCLQMDKTDIIPVLKNNCLVKLG